MRNCLILITLLFAKSIFAQNDSIIIVKEGTGITVDGIIEANEWTDADSLILEIETDWVSKVYYKYDGSHLLFAFTNLEQISGNPHSVDLLFDKFNNPFYLDNMDDDDVWIHASFGDCEAVGTYYDWNTCSESKPDWLANNLPFSNGNDNIEFEINISKLDNLIGDTLGFTMVLTGNVDTYWPESASLDYPISWGKLLIESNATTIKANTSSLAPLVSPNPVQGVIYIDNNANTEYKIFDIVGTLVTEGITNSGEVDISNLEKGTYIVNLFVNNKMTSAKFIVEQ